MLSILSAIFGFAAPFLPELVKLFRNKQDNAHELAMMEIRMKYAAQEHLWRMEEISTQADIAEAVALHRPMQSFGVQLLDAAKDSRMANWATLPVFWMFAFLDFVAGMVRPAVTYGMVAFYMAVKISIYQASQGGMTVADLWRDEDWAVLTLTLSYWFGHRAAKAAFGGSASTGKPGA